jgi:hypothetical protein
VNELRWRSLEEDGAAISCSSYLEWQGHRLLGELVSSLASPSDQLWCAAASRSHGFRARQWEEILPLTWLKDLASDPGTTTRREALDAVLEMVIDEARRSRTVDSIVGVLYPGLGRAYRSWLDQARARPAVDAPIVVVLSRVLADLDLVSSDARPCSPSPAATPATTPAAETETETETGAGIETGSRARAYEARPGDVGRVDRLLWVGLGLL